MTMKRGLTHFRCSLGWHRWRQIKVGEERGRECSDCKLRKFGTSGYVNPNDPDVALRTTPPPPYY
jgi:hypothetical protein